MDATPAMDAPRSTSHRGGHHGACPLAPLPSAKPAESESRAGRTINGILFDTDDVLYDATPWPRRLWRLVRALGVSAGYGEFFDRWEHHYLVVVSCGRREDVEAFQSFLLAWGLSWAQIDEVEAASRVEWRDFERCLRPLPGVVKTIARLAESGVAMAAWADSGQPAARLAERLERIGLGGRFGRVLTSFELEAAQPAEACYRALLDALGKPARDVLYVGHDALHLAGAAGVGLRTAAFNYQPGAAADFYLGGFEELTGLVESSAPPG
jgi:FMN phosphatase YigB (HAD superfamily)